MAIDFVVVITGPPKAARRGDTFEVAKRDPRWESMGQAGHNKAWHGP
jgi:hypothetical protein